AASQAQSQLDFGNIDADTTGSITIHKMVPAAGDTEAGTPDGANAPDGTALANVEFTIYQLSEIDLTDVDGWDELDGYAPVCPPADAEVVDVATTGVDGTAAFANLDVGAYVVCETDAPETVVATA